MSTAVATKARPILFSGPLVRAILDGRKTQTRRVCKFQPNMGVYSSQRWEAGLTEDGQWQFTSPVCGEGWTGQCPYGATGDRLWVRETFQPFFKDGFIYLADAGTGRLNAHSEEQAKANWPGWRPSIHMPREASRITLEIIEVRAQRLQEISEEDAIAEGAQCAGVPASLTNRGAFAKLWDTINGKRGFGWDTNPWVWAITFRRRMK